MIAALLISSLLMHPFHETVSELQWNEKSGRLEVAIRLHVVDEQWLKHQAMKQLGNDDSRASWQIQYLRGHFLLDPKSRQQPKTIPAGKTSGQTVVEKRPEPHRYHWVGTKEEGAHVWWFFEIEPTDRQRPRRIEQLMLYEYEKDFAHRVIVLPTAAEQETSPKIAPKSPLALTLTIQRPGADLFPNADPKPNDDDPTPQRP